VEVANLQQSRGDVFARPVIRTAAVEIQSVSVFRYFDCVRLGAVNAGLDMIRFFQMQFDAVLQIVVEAAVVNAFVEYAFELFCRKVHVIVFCFPGITKLVKYAFIQQ